MTFLIALGLLIALTAGCGSGDNLTMTPKEQAAALEAQASARESQPTSTTAEPTTTTTATPTTMTTVCVPTDTTAQERYIDATTASIRQTEGAIAQIQLIIDNSTRDRAGALRYQESVQDDRNDAAAAFSALPIDTNADKLAYQERRLADAKDNVASWDALLAKARGDLTRAKVQKADFERKIREMQAQVAAATSC